MQSLGGSDAYRLYLHALDEYAFSAWVVGCVPSSTRHAFVATNRRAAAAAFPDCIHLHGPHPPTCVGFSTPLAVLGGQQGWPHPPPCWSARLAPTPKLWQESPARQGREWFVPRFVKGAMYAYVYMHWQDTCQGPDMACLLV